MAISALTAWPRRRSRRCLLRTSYPFGGTAPAPAVCTFVLSSCTRPAVARVLELSGYLARGGQVLVRHPALSAIVSADQHPFLALSTQNGYVSSFSEPARHSRIFARGGPQHYAQAVGVDNSHAVTRSTRRTGTGGGRR